MTDKLEHNQTDPLMDTQKLLQGVQPPEGGDFQLEDILAEYGGGRPDKKERSASPAPESPPEPAAQRSPSPPAAKPPLSAPVEAGNASALRPDNDIDSISPEDLFGFSSQAAEASQPGGPRQADSGIPQREAPSPDDAAPAGEAPAVSMEDIVASTVDAVKEDQARRQDKLRKRLEKERKKKAARPVKKRTPALRHPLPEEAEEPAMSEAAAWHRRWYALCRRSLLVSLPVLALLWLPWILQQFGVVVPFFSGSSGNAALCVLIPQAVLCVLCWPVFHAALNGLRERSCTVYFLAALCNVATLLDEMTLLFLPGRSSVSPLGGVAAAAAVFSLWGLTGYHRGLWESFRTAAMGEPSYLVDCCEAGIAKGRGRCAGFYTRATMEDTASQWQRLLLPVIAVASLVFAVLATVGQGRGQDLLWCWSVILCASSSLVFPLVYCVPFGRLAARLNRSGAAVAGQYGACVLTSSRQIVVTDSDLFPQGTVSLNGLKLYGEERNRAISYAATLAVQAGGCLGRIFEDICRNDRISYQSLEHFHIHDDNGLSGIIHGETVLVGPPIFMRHRGVRLPATLPSKTSVCLAVDGELTAVFAVKYNTSGPVESALRALGRNGLQLTLAVRDGNITPKLLKTRFGTDGGAISPEVSDRLALSDPEREADAPNGLLYRDGLFPFVEMAAGSRRLCHTIRFGNLLSLLGSISGALLSFYLTFTGSYAVLTPVMLLTYLLLWVVPMLPLLYGMDKT